MIHRARPPSDGSREPRIPQNRQKGCADRPLRPRRVERPVKLREPEGRASTAFTASPLRSGVPASTPPVRRRLGADIAARGLETRIMSLEEISARAARGRPSRAAAPGSAARPPWRRRGELPANGRLTITDPHNLSAILAAFSALRHHRAPFGPSPGPGEVRLGRGSRAYTICSVTNLGSRALAELGDMGYSREVGLKRRNRAALGETLSHPLGVGPGRGGRTEALKTSRAVRSVLLLDICRYEP